MDHREGKSFGALNWALRLVRRPPGLKGACGAGTTDHRRAGGREGSGASRAFVVLLVGLRRTAVALAEPGEDQAELRSVGIVPVRSSGWFSSPSVHAATLSLAARRSLT